jgi:hypothetical protein
MLVVVEVDHLPVQMQALQLQVSVVVDFSQRLKVHLEQHMPVAVGVEHLQLQLQRQVDLVAVAQEELQVLLALTEQMDLVVAVEEAEKLVEHQGAVVLEL